MCEKGLVSKIQSHIFILNRYKIMASCWNFIPQERPTFTQLVQIISKQLLENVDDEKLDRENSEDSVDS